MQGKLKEFCKKHKKVIIGGTIVIGGATVILLTAKIAGKFLPRLIEASNNTKNNFWNFDKLDEALEKFKELEDICLKAGAGEYAIFGGGYGENAGKYTVMHL